MKFGITLFLIFWKACGDVVIGNMLSNKTLNFPPPTTGVLGSVVGEHVTKRAFNFSFLVPVFNFFFSVFYEMGGVF